MSQGIQGVSGPQGPRGIQGDLGPQGPAGFTGPQGIQGIQGPAGSGGGGGATPGGSNTHVQFNVNGALGGSSTFVFDVSTGRVGIGTSAPVGSLDVSATLANPVNIRTLLYGRMPVSEVSGTTVTLASSNANTYFHLTNSGFSNATLPSATPVSDAGIFWTLKNATGASLSITLTNTLTLLSPLVIPPGNTSTLVVSGVTSNTVLLM